MQKIDFKGYCQSCVNDKKLKKKSIKIKDRYPAGIERSLNKILREQFIELDKQLKALVEAELKRMPRNDSLERNDAYLDQLKNFFNALKDKVKTPKKYNEWYTQFAEKIGKWNTENFVKGVNDELGVDFYVPNSQVTNDMLKDWVTANYDVVERYGLETIQKLQDTITREYMSGKRATEIEPFIAGEFNPKIAKQKAKIWSRNEVGNLNTNLTKARHKELGIEKSIWSTSGDERVRCEHKGYDGKEYPTKTGITRKWLEENNIPVTCSGSVNVKQKDGSFKTENRTGDRGKEIDYYGGAIWAGTPINCRCVAIAVIDIEVE